MIGLFSNTATSTKIESDILEFGRLPEGWHYGKGGPIESRIIFKALELLWKLRLVRSDAVFESFPTADGTVVISTILDGTVLDIALRPDDSNDVYFEQDNVTQFEKEALSDEEVTGVIESILWNLPKSSGYFTPSISVTISNASIAPQSNLHMMGCPSSTPNVRPPKQDASAITVADITRNASQENRQYSFG